MDENLIVKINYEISQIDKLFDKSHLLIEKSLLQTPDYVELTALGSILHSYYNGIESIFLIISKNIDRQTLGGERWHRHLLDTMFENKASRNAVLPLELQPQMIDYLGFRHFYRHAYGFEIIWNKIKPLVYGLTDNWSKVKKAFLQFIEQ